MTITEAFIYLVIIQVVLFSIQEVLLKSRLSDHYDDLSESISFFRYQLQYDKLLPLIKEYAEMNGYLHYNLGYEGKIRFSFNGDIFTSKQIHLDYIEQEVNTLRSFLNKNCPIKHG